MTFRWFAVLVPAAGCLLCQTKSNTERLVARWDVQQSGTQDDLLGVFFIDRNTGWAVSKRAAILKTTDEGKTWTQIAAPRERGDFHSIVFTTPSDGWVEGSAGLLHTSDGGESWQPANSLHANSSGFGAGAVVGNTRYQLPVSRMGAVLYKTTDNGNHWEALGKLPANSFESLFFLNAHRGWAGRDFGHMISTSDGGMTWSAETELPLRATIEKIQFVDERMGWAISHRGHNGGPVATLDGGVTWTNYDAGVKRPIPDMYFFDKSNGLLLAEAERSSVVLRSANGGKTWQPFGTVEKYSKALAFPSMDKGWVVGPKGYIVHYHLVPAAAK